MPDACSGIGDPGVGQTGPWYWLIIAWLVIVNTALTFTIWNFSLRILTAYESSTINNLMMPQITIFAYVFLHETLARKEIIGLVLVGIGVWMAQSRGPG